MRNLDDADVGMGPKFIVVLDLNQCSLKNHVPGREQLQELHDHITRFLSDPGASTLILPQSMGVKYEFYAIGGITQAKLKAMRAAIKVKNG